MTEQTTEQTAEHNPQVRRFLEQMMMRFTMLGVPVERAAHELLEIETHIEASRQDPFEEFGDPQKLATDVIPLEERKALYRRGLRHDLVVGGLMGVAFAAAIQFVLSLFGQAVTSVPKLVIMFTLGALYGAGQIAFSRILTGTADDDQSLRLRGAALVCLVAFFAALVFSLALGLAGADFTGAEPFEGSRIGWLLAALVLGAASSVIAYQSWKLKKSTEPVIEGGVTGQILYEMNHNGFVKGWVQYGPNGEDLRDPNYSTIGSIRNAWTAGSSGQ